MIISIVQSNYLTNIVWLFSLNKNFDYLEVLFINNVTYLA
jgi:hypothetical protein